MEEIVTKREKVVAKGGGCSCQVGKGHKLTDM